MSGPPQGGADGNVGGGADAAHASDAVVDGARRAALRTPLDARSRRRRRWTLGALAVIVAGALVAWTFVPSERELTERAIASLREAGFATTIAELRGPDPPESANGAVEFRAAVAKEAELTNDAEKAALPGPWNPDLAEDWYENATPDQFDAMAAFVAKLAPAYALLDAASAKSRLRFDAADPETFEWLDVRPLLESSRLLSVRILGAADPAERIAAAGTSLRIARRIECTSILEHMIALAYAGQGADHLRRQIETGRVTARAARPRIDPELSGTFRVRYPQAVRAEIAWCASLLERHVVEGRPLPEGFAEFEFAPWYESVWEGSPFRGARTGLPALRRLAELPPGSARTLLTACQAEEEAASPGEEVIGIVLPQMARKFVQADAQLALCRVALAVRERHETTGAWPASLDDLRDAFPGEAVPLDPYTDAPFVYEVAADAVRIASAGRVPDAPARTNAELREDGLVWELPR